MKNKSLLFALFGLGIVVSFFFLDLFFEKTSFSVSHLFNSKINYYLISLAVLLQIIAHILRAKKSGLLIDPIKPSNFRTLFQGLTIGFLFNALLPFRIGELIRAHIIGRKMSISRAVILVTILFERSLDGLVLSFAAFFIFAVNTYRNNSTNTTFLFLAGSVFVISVLVGAISLLLYSQNKKLILFLRWISQLFNTNLRDRLRFILWSIIYGMHLVLSKAKLKQYIFLTVLMWAIYISSIFLIIYSFFPNLDFTKLTTFSTSSYLSVSVPSGPAYLGTYHFYISNILSALTGNQEQGLIISFTTWLVLVGPISILGLYFLTTLKDKTRRNRNVEGNDLMKNKLYRESDISKDFSLFLDDYFSGSTISQILNLKEIENEFKLIKIFRGGSNALTMLVWEKNNYLVKKMCLPKDASKLRAQYNWLLERKNLPHIPKVLDEKETEEAYHYNQQYNEKYLPFFNFIHSENIEKSKQILGEVVDFSYKDIYLNGTTVRSKKKILDYIDSKVISKVVDTEKESLVVKNLLGYETLNVNGEVYDNFYQIIGKIKQNKQAMEDLSTFEQTQIHGDLTIDNIIVSRDNNDFLILDPNNENAISDPIVDFAKLYQSLHSGYEFLYKLDLTDVNNNSVNFEDSISAKYYDLYIYLNQKLKNQLTEAGFKSLVFHEAVHYCRMLTYRVKINPETLPAFFAIAVKLFNQFYKQYEKK